MFGGLGLMYCCTRYSGNETSALNARAEVAAFTAFCTYPVRSTWYGFLFFVFRQRTPTNTLTTFTSIDILLREFRATGVDLLMHIYIFLSVLGWYILDISGLRLEHRLLLLLAEESIFCFNRSCECVYPEHGTEGERGAIMGVSGR